MSGRRKREVRQRIRSTDVTDVTHILHHSQERALRPVPQRVDFLVEQAEKPVADNGARYQM
ncbi:MULTISPECIES: hypothetical protein [unclassified Microcoleus]|uniref:hypothetical protein n=1 Tax=unclassified Microcoleus TaxID=2642155 RepID=UPI002FD48B67